jgi:hypothetical protein
VRHLILLDATLLVARLVKRQDEMVALFSRLRDRSPLMAATHTTFHSIGFDSLAALTPVEQRAATAFFELVAELRWYLQYTEDMPSTLRTGLERLVSRLREGLAVLTGALGPLDADGARVIEGEARHP